MSFLASDVTISCDRDEYSGALIVISDYNWCDILYCGIIYNYE